MTFYMQRKHKLLIAKVSVAAAVAPVLLWAYQFGPDPGFVAVPGENGGATCATAGCHSGVPNDPSYLGGITLNFPNGATYTPGVAQQLSVTIADPAPAQKAWGFELTARVASSISTMAGTLAPVDALTQLVCSESNLQIFENPAGSAGCPASFPLVYIEHNQTGYNDSLGKTGSYTYNFMWTPPATDVGDITFYVAANAGVGGVSPTATRPPAGDHIYAKTFTVSSAAVSAAPAITSGGVVNGASFQAGVVPNSWITIVGTNLANTTDTWANAVGADGTLPTSLDGVSVSVGGSAAYIYYISQTQINALAPDIGTGAVPVTVTNNGVTSATASVVSQAVQPAFFLWPGGYAVATHADFSWAVKNGTFSTPTTPAKPGETIILWGSGFGPTSPAPPVGFATPSAMTYFTASAVTVAINGLPATVFGAGAALAPGAAGLYQLAVQVPASLANGDYTVVASINGAQSPVTTLITVQQ